MVVMRVNVNPPNASISCKLSETDKRLLLSIDFGNTFIRIASLSIGSPPSLNFTISYIIAQKALYYLEYKAFLLMKIKRKELFLHYSNRHRRSEESLVSQGESQEHWFCGMFFVRLIRLQ